MISAIIYNIPRAINIGIAKPISIIPFLHFVKPITQSIVLQHFHYFFICKTKGFIKFIIRDRIYFKIVQPGKDAFLCNPQASCQYRKSKAVICFQHISKEIANQKNHFIIVAVFICFCQWYIIFINQYYYLLMIMFFKKHC